MNAKEKLAIELIVMNFASYVHTLALLMAPNQRASYAIDAAWDDFKKSAAHNFAGWKESQ